MPIVPTIDSVLENCIGYAFPPIYQAVAAANWTIESAESSCRRCGDSVGPGETTDTGCTTCREGAELAGGIGDGVVRLGTYANDLKEWVGLIKYARWTEMGGYLGQQLGNVILQAKVIDPDRTIIVPMAMPWPRRFFRGIDHAQVIASGVASVMKSPLVSILKRSHEPPQTSLSRSERRRRGSRGLQIRRRLGRWQVSDAHIVLVDDVRTTGATLLAATRLLRTLKPKKVICGVLAVSDSKARKQRTEHRDG